MAQWGDGCGADEGRAGSDVMWERRTVLGETGRDILDRRDSTGEADVTGHTGQVGYEASGMQILPYCRYWIEWSVATVNHTEEGVIRGTLNCLNVHWVVQRKC